MFINLLSWLTFIIDSFELTSLISTIFEYWLIFNLSAIWGPTWPVPPSKVCVPVKIISNSVDSRYFEMIKLVAYESLPTKLLSLISTALSTPNRSTSFKSFSIFIGPIETTSTYVSGFSFFFFNAHANAFVSSGLRINRAFSRLILSFFASNWAPAAFGTYFTKQIILILSFLF